ncbi:MAG TPA: protoporphyrinogen oxidase [Acidimicrobiales bacterium]|nr:protoporphyrinogen oxidase [Acidimicrobiales bacterium]
MADRSPTVAVVGGGIAGLSAAWELCGGGASVTAATHRPAVVVLESEPRAGGRLLAAPFAGRTVDLGADAFVARRPEATDLCRELGLDEDLVPPGAAGASVWARGDLRALPRALNLGVPTRWWPLARSRILTTGETLAVAGDLFRPHRRPEPVFGDRAVGEIVGDRLGRPVVDRLTDPMVGGIHAGSADELSAAALVPLLIAADAQPGSLLRRLRRAQEPTEDGTPVFLSLRTSTASLADRLADALRLRGVEIRLATRVVAVEANTAVTGARFRLSLQSSAGSNGRASEAEVGRYVGGRWESPMLEVDALVVATDAGQAAVLLAPLAPVAAGLLSAVDHASVATITLALPPGTVGDRPGTGFLVPRTSLVGGRVPLVTACTYLDRKWPHLRVDHADLVRLSVGRHRDERHTDLDDDELVETATGELARMLGAAPPPRPAEALVTRWPAAFPQYAVGHLVGVARMMEDVNTVGGLAVAGAALRGVGIPACVSSGRQAARRVLDSLAAAADRAPAGRPDSSGPGAG